MEVSLDDLMHGEINVLPDAIWEGHFFANERRMSPEDVFLQRDIQRTTGSPRRIDAIEEVLIDNRGAECVNNM